MNSSVDNYTYDINPSKGMALVAEQDGTNPRYITLEDAPEAITPATYFQLRQMHSAAVGIIDGVVGTREPGFAADEWQQYGQPHGKAIS